MLITITDIGNIAPNAGLVGPDTSLSWELTLHFQEISYAFPKNHFLP